MVFPRVMILALVLVVFTLGRCSNAYAEGFFKDWHVVSEFGMGYKDFNTTSVIAQSTCQQVFVTQGGPREGTTASCGGNNPIFVGWPIAVEKCFFKNCAVRWRNGMWHQSQWFDRNEIHIDAALSSITVDWTNLLRNKRSKRQ